MSCGYQACDKRDDGKSGHIKDHLHSIFVDVVSQQIWCIRCDREVKIDPALKQDLELIMERLFDQKSSFLTDLPQTQLLFEMHGRKRLEMSKKGSVEPSNLPPIDM
jgi:hypothetical protein